MAPVIVVKNIIKKYGDVVALDNVTFEVNAGEIFGLLGPNGAGKTTLIRIITGQLEPTNGTIEVLGVNHADFLNSDVRFKVSYVPQENIIWEYLTVEENLQLMASMYKLSRGELREKVENLLVDFDLKNVRKRLANKLSGGMKRKLTIAMALVNDPEILILDEPTAGLDPKTRAMMLGNIEKLKELGKTILLTTHIVEEVERIADRVAIINNGKMIAIDKPANLKKMSCGNEVLDLLFEQLDTKAFEILHKIVEDKNLITVGDRVIIKEDRLAEILEKIKENEKLSEQILTITLRKSSLEDAFLFLTGRLLRGE